MRFAGIWVPDESARESYMQQDGKTRAEWMQEQAKSACEVYTKWCNGECYGFIIKAFDAIRDEDGCVMEELNDYRRKTPVLDDSCWGFIGWEDVVQGINDNLPASF